MLSSVLRSLNSTSTTSRMAIGAVSALALVSAVNSRSSTAAHSEEKQRGCSRRSVDSANGNGKRDRHFGPFGREFFVYKVRSVEAVTHDTKRIVFDLPADHDLDLKAASILVARAKVDGRRLIRPYTPVRVDEEQRELELVVKGVPHGAMSTHLTQLKPGDELQMMGPVPKFEYKPNKFNTVALLAAGSGLTPALQMINQICNDPNDTTRIVLVFANRTEADIILRDELDALAAEHPQLSVHYVLSSPPTDGSWTGKTGHINKALVQELVPAPSADVFVGVCGPPAMMDSLSGRSWFFRQGRLTGTLKDLGYDRATVHKF